MQQNSPCYKMENNTGICTCLLQRSTIDELAEGHIVCQFIDDSTSVVGFSDFQVIEAYLEKYILLLGEFYCMNRLKINQDKTMLLICPAKKNYNPPISLMNDTIKPKNSIKILGSLFTDTGTAHADLAATLRSCYHTLSILYKIKSLTTVEIRTQFVQAHVMSRLMFSISSYSSLPQYHLDKIHKLIMKAGRYSKGSYCFKMRCTDILNSINILNHKALIYVRACSEIHRVLLSKQPPSILSMFNINRRSCSKIYLRSPPQTSQGSKSCYLHKNLNFYNSLPSSFKNLDNKNFKKAIMKQVRLTPERDWLRG